MKDASKRQGGEGKREDETSLIDEWTCQVRIDDKNPYKVPSSRVDDPSPFESRIVRHAKG